MGGAKDGVGTVLLGKPKGLSALTVLLRGLEITPAEIETACRRKLPRQVDTSKLDSARA